MNHKDIKAVVILLATQGLINIGSLPDPVKGRTIYEPDKAGIFLDLLEVLQAKTRGNLSDDELKFLQEAIQNLDSIIRRKTGAGESE